MKRDRTGQVVPTQIVSRRVGSSSSSAVGTPTTRAGSAAVILGAALLAVSLPTAPAVADEGSEDPQGRSPATRATSLTDHPGFVDHLPEELPPPAVSAPARSRRPAGSQRGRQNAPGRQAGGWQAGVRGVLPMWSSDTLDETFGVTGFAQYRFTPDVLGEIEVGWVSTETSRMEGDLPDGDLTVIPLRASALFRVWRFGEVVPYVGGGGGAYFNSFGLDDAVVSRLDSLGFDVDQTVDTTFGLHAGGGLQWDPGEWALGVDIKYVRATADTAATVRDRVSGIEIDESGELDLDGFWIAVGVQLNF